LTYFFNFYGQNPSLPNPTNGDPGIKEFSIPQTKTLFPFVIVPDPGVKSHLVYVYVYESPIPPPAAKTSYCIQVFLVLVGVTVDVGVGVGVIHGPKYESTTTLFLKEITLIIIKREITIIRLYKMMEKSRVFNLSKLI
jgi:hypothetical protein